MREKRLEFSPAEALALLPESEREAVLAELTPAEANGLEFDFKWWGRPKQQPPAGDWRVWAVLAGRGFGKTRCGGEWIRTRINEGARHIVFVAPTMGDMRDIMIEGESGILAISPPWERPVYEPSKKRLTWRHTGARAVLLSADEPERARGKQSDTIWAEELASWRYPETYDQLMFTHRLGDSYGIQPKTMVTTTPKPVKLIREFIKRAENPADVRVTRGTTYENKHNLAKAFIDQVVRRYEGTRLGRQELNAELLEDVEGALWNRARIDILRVATAPPLRRIVIAVDPSASSTDESDEAGILAGGIGYDGHGYVLDDLSDVMAPDEWAKAAVDALNEWDADRIVAERNNGGEMVELTIRTVDKNAPYKSVWASQGKRTRAEPIAALYEQAKIHHVGTFAALEDELCTHDFSEGKASPNRLDALVWLFTELMLEKQAGRTGKTGKAREMAGSTGGF